MTRSRPKAPFYDVFLSYSARDAALGEVVTRRFGDAGLSVFAASAADFEEGIETADGLREALMESTAFVVLLTAAHKDSPALTFEVGAAWGKQMPIYILVEEEEPADLPIYLSRHEVHPLTQLPVVIASIAEAAKPLAESQQAALVAAYTETRVPVDSLLMRPAALAEFARAYRRLTGRQMPGNRLTRELLRLRKQGRLPAVPK